MKMTRALSACMVGFTLRAMTKQNDTPATRAPAKHHPPRRHAPAAGVRAPPRHAATGAARPRQAASGRAATLARCRAPGDPRAARRVAGRRGRSRALSRQVESHVTRAPASPSPWPSTRAPLAPGSTRPGAISGGNPPGAVAQPRPFTDRGRPCQGSRRGRRDGRDHTDPSPGQIRPELAIVVPGPAPALPAAQSFPLTMVYEDDQVLVVNKAAGMVVHPAPGKPADAGECAAGPLQGSVGHRRRTAAGHRASPGPGHPGVMVVAKDDGAHAALAAQFAAHSLRPRLSGGGLGRARAGEVKWRARSARPAPSA